MQEEGLEAGVVVILTGANTNDKKQVSMSKILGHRKDVIEYEVLLGPSTKVGTIAIQTKEIGTGGQRKNRRERKRGEGGRKGEGVCWASSSRWTERKRSKRTGDRALSCVGCEVD